jgi:hypothetical protein
MIVSSPLKHTWSLLLYRASCMAPIPAMCVGDIAARENASPSTYTSVSKTSKVEIWDGPNVGEHLLANRSLPFQAEVQTLMSVEARKSPREWQHHFWEHMDRPEDIDYRSAGEVKPWLGDFMEIGRTAKHSSYTADMNNNRLRQRVRWTIKSCELALGCGVVNNIDNI